MRRLPIIPTVFVGLAVATMIALGFWQLGKVEAQEQRLAQREVNAAKPAIVAFPLTKEEVDRLAYRRSSFTCDKIVGEKREVAGRNANDQSGFVHIVTCVRPDGEQIDVQLGWSPVTRMVDWRGGEVTGVIEPLRTGFAKLVADPPLAGLLPNAAPEKKRIDHLAYAGQWFFFALTALLIYGFALRSRMRKQN